MLFLIGLQSQAGAASAAVAVFVAAPLVAFMMTFLIGNVP